MTRVRSTSLQTNSQFSRNVPHSPISAVFRRSSNLKTAFNVGNLIPVFSDEVLPGDVFDLSAVVFGRFSTLIVPMLDNMDVSFYFFYVPNRILSPYFETVMGDASFLPPDQKVDDFFVPYLVTSDVSASSVLSKGFATNSIYDYMGLPVNVALGGQLVKPGAIPALYTVGPQINSLFFRAYNLIWNEYFRDEFLQPPVKVYNDFYDKYDDVGLFKLLPTNKMRDYFTSAIPFPQFGQNVVVPLQGRAPVSGLGMGIDSRPYSSANVETYSAVYETKDLDSDPGSPSVVRYPASFISAVPPDIASYPAVIGGDLKTRGIVMKLADPGVPGPYVPQVFAEYSKGSAPGVTFDVDDLRYAVQLQRFFERDARSGVRYFEILNSHFGVVSPDSRLQRPEFLGSISAPLSVNPVAQTSSTVSTGGNSTSPQGNLAAFSTIASSKHVFKRRFVEHGVILGLALTRSQLSYSQGIHKKFTRIRRFDFAFPEFAHLGEQPILNQEIFYSPPASANDINPVNSAVFGYQQRYAEYRYYPNFVTSLMRPTADSHISYWHLSQEFGDLPSLTDAFIRENPPIDRIVAVPSQPHILLDMQFELSCRRPLPYQAIPGYIDQL